MFRRDYLMRQIQELAEALRRIAGHQRAGQQVLALQEAGEAYRRFGVDESLLKYMDAASLVRLMGHDQAAEKLVELVELEASLHEDDPEAARALQRRAADLRAALADRPSP